MNMDIRREVFESHLVYRDIAREMKVSPEYLSRIMRCELSEKNRQRVKAAIDALKKQ